MDGRWRSLTLDAHSTKAIDYSKCTRDNPETLLKEALVLDYMEELRHRKYSETLALFDLTILSNVDSLTSQSLQDKAEKYRDMLFPWITVERPKFWINDNLDADELKKFGLTMEDA